MNKYLLILLLLSVSACSQKVEKENSNAELPFYEEASFTPHWFEVDNELPEDFHKIPEFSLINQFGETVTEKVVEDKIFIVDFFFASCSGICPKLTTNMSLVQEAFLNDDEIILLSHSVTPTLDTPRVLKAFGKTKGVVEGKWHLLTGDRNQIYDLGRNYYFIEEDLGLEKNPDEFIHTENLLLVDQNRNIRGIYNGLNRTSVNHLIEDIKKLKKKVSS
ncbi:MAG: SCO family protein [Balneolaceae bacterium]